MGSIKNKIVAKDLQDERNNCNFDRAVLKIFWRFALSHRDTPRVRKFRKILWDDERGTNQKMVWDYKRFLLTW